MTWPTVSSAPPPKLVPAASVSYLNLLPNSILDKLVLHLLPNSILDKLIHLLAQVSYKGLRPQGTSGLLTFLQLFFQ